MLYLNTPLLDKMSLPWYEVIETVGDTTAVLGNDDYQQPIKSYLRYRDPRNRIISMPAFVGAQANVAGIKWIASFPENINQDIPRAHSVTILNAADTGIPFCIINSAVISGVRTAGVTGLVLRRYLTAKPNRVGLRAGIIGLGPIGKLHAEMMLQTCNDRIESYHVFDIKGVPDHFSTLLDKKLVVENDWRPIVERCDIVITCTVASTPYIRGVRPRPGSLHLNISLRDYEAAFAEYVRLMIVDKWEEVCRENTSIELMHLERGLKKTDTVSIYDVAFGRCFDQIGDGDVVMFNPMGMAIFDIAVGKMVYDKAREQGVGMELI